MTFHQRGRSQTTLTRFGLFFDHLHPFVVTFYGINVDKKWTFLDHLPTLSCKCSLWTTPKRVERECLLLWPSLLLLLSFCLNMNLLGGSFNNYVDQILHTFWPPTPLEWTIVDILHKTYPLFTWPGMDFLLNTYLPLLVHVGFEWPLEKKNGWRFSKEIPQTHSHFRNERYAKQFALK